MPTTHHLVFSPQNKSIWFAHHNVANREIPAWKERTCGNPRFQPQEQSNRRHPLPEKMPPRPADQVRLSLIEKVKLVLFYAVVITKTCGSALTAPFAAPANRSKVYKRHVAYSLVRHLFSNSNTRIDQYDQAPAPYH